LYHICFSSVDYFPLHTDFHSNGFSSACFPGDVGSLAAFIKCIRVRWSFAGHVFKLG